MAHHTSDLLCPACEEKLAQAHPDLVKWYRGVKTKHADAHVSWSHRNEQEQNQCLADGKTKLAWPHSAHNFLPARALDLFEIDENQEGVWDPHFFASLSADLQLEGAPILWGGTFKTLGDLDHFQLKD